MRTQKAFSEGGHGYYSFDPKSFKHKFKRKHSDTPQGQIDTNTTSSLKNKQTNK